MAILLANADGTVYHRYGGREDISPMKIDTLIEIMHKGLESHKKYLSTPYPLEHQEPLKLRQLIDERLPGKIKPTYGCYHCHYAREAKQYLALESKTWTPDQFWIWPLPENLGLIMNQEQQYKIEKVIANSAAEKAKIQSGDLLQTLMGTRILTKYDIQWILEQSSNKAIILPYSLLRNDNLIEGEIYLEKGWKVGNPEDYQWRIRNVFTEHMAKFLPVPGFIGKQLSKNDLSLLDLTENRFALKVTKLSYGTYLAGIHQDDVILGLGGKREYLTVREFYYDCEKMWHSNQDIQVELLRQGILMKVVIPLSYLNYTKIEKAPQVMLGFIAQELPGEYLRVGSIKENSHAEKIGLLTGDRIELVDGKKINTYDELQRTLSNKSPGDMLTLEVRRREKLLSFAFVLTSEEKKQTDLLQLDQEVSEKEQQITCIVTIKLPQDKHIYSVNKESFGIPTSLDFRGRGYKLIGEVNEPNPKKIEDQAGIMWILEGVITLTQVIEVTDPKNFYLTLSVYAQVCDDHSCHDFRAIVENDGIRESFDFLGYFEQQPKVITEK